MIEEVNDEPTSNGNRSQPIVEEPDEGATKVFAYVFSNHSHVTRRLQNTCMKNLGQHYKPDKPWPTCLTCLLLPMLP